jgi:hypothetical protein
MASEICAYAQNLPVSYSPPVLKAPYTLVFSVNKTQFIKIASPAKGKKNLYYSDEPIPKKLNGPLTLTFSVNGHRILYLLQAGKWKNVKICDLDHDYFYYYNSELSNAIIQPGALIGIARMSFFPMPGVGYYVCTMFQSFSLSSSGLSHAKMIINRSIIKDTNGKLNFSSRDALVEIDSKNNPPILKSCVIYRRGASAKLAESWTFSGVKYLGVVPLSKKSVHLLYIPASTHVESHQAANSEGSTTATSTITFDPKSPTIPESKTVYTLISCTDKALPNKDYNLETYVPEKCIITDFRNKL